MKKWLSSSDVKTVIYEYKESIYGVGSIGMDGTIHLCYVSPEHVNSGIGKALLAELIEIAKLQNLKAVKLVSTKTAKGFYERNGFTCSNKAEPCFGILGYPMYRIVDG